MEAYIVLKSGIDEKIKQNIEYSIIKAFSHFGIPARKENKTLIFTGPGTDKDFAHIMLILIKLILEDWFLNNAEAVWTVKKDGCEDVLSQADMIRTRLLPHQQKTVSGGE